MKILFDIQPTHNGKALGIITLNNPKALNAQDLDMVEAMADKLTEWENDDTIAAIVLQGAGDKALCAGGDIKGLYYALVDDKPELTAQFFETEYALMHQLHTYNKPIIAWGNGIVMGGGLGLFAGSSHKVVTENTLMAMPEVSIGLFPDAGGTYFLNRMPNKIGLFLGMTGARFTGADAYHLGLADFAIDSNTYQTMLDKLLCADWSEDGNYNHGIANAVLTQLHKDDLVKNPPIAQEIPTINQLMNAGNLLDIDKALHDYNGDSNFIKAAQDFYIKGSPITKALTYGLHLKSKTLSLQEILNIELNVAIYCCTKGDLKEGVRALLIDKDKNPQWQMNIEEVVDSIII